MDEKKKRMMNSVLKKETITRKLMILVNTIEILSGLSICYNVFLGNVKSFKLR